MNKNVHALTAPAAAALCALLAACGPGDQATSDAPPMPVQVVEVQRRDIPLVIEMVGSTLGTQDVPIRARVEGFLDSMNFREGSFVEKGELLYTIDAQPFQARLVESQSRLATAETSLVKAESDLGRIRPLAEINAVSAQDLDSAVAQYEAAKAGVQAAEAAVDLTEIELSYTRIEAPIAGLIGLSKAKPGEFVGRDPNPVVLNVLSDIDPIRVRFSISEREYLIFARGADDAFDRRRDEDRIKLTLLLADGSEFPQKGVPAGSAQSIDPETGTYTVEALFPNPDKILLPGQFARVRAPYSRLNNAVVVPRRAISELQGRFRVFLVNDQDEVEIREIVPGPVKNNDQVIDDGLTGGERVIVEGLQKVRPGMKVAPKPVREATPAPPIQET